MNVERRIRILSMSSAAMLLVLLGAVFVILMLIRTQQEEDEQRLSPVRSEAQALDQAIAQLFLREAKIAAAGSSQAVAELSDRSALEQRIKTAGAQLEPLLHEHQLDALHALHAHLGAMLEADTRYTRTMLDQNKDHEAMVAAIREVEAELISFLESTKAIAGKLRFAQGSARRRLQRHVQLHGFDAEAASEAQAELLSGTGRRNGLVTDVLALAAELNRLSGEIALLRNEDELRSLSANELTPMRDGLTVALEELLLDSQQYPEVVAIITQLEGAFPPLAARIMDPGQGDSILALRRRVLERQRQAEAMRLELADHGRRVSAQTARLMSEVDAQAKRFSRRLAAVASVGTWLFLVLAVSALVGGAVGARQVQHSIAELRGQNQTLSEAREQLRAANHNLEAKVEERTRTIRTILDHVKTGFFLCDSHGVIDPGHTQSCLGLFAAERISGRTVPEVLGLDARAADNLLAHLYQAFDDVLPENVIYDQMHARYPAGPRMLRLDGSSVRDAQGNVVRVLFSVVDITELEAAERSNVINLALLRMLKSKSAFARFLFSLTEHLAILREQLQASDQGAARRELHTLKGNLGLYGLHEAAALTHRIEDRAEISLDAVESIRLQVVSFLDEHYDVLGLRLDEQSQERVSIGVEQLEHLLALSERAGTLAAVKRELRAFVQQTRLRPAGELLGPIPELVSRLGERLEKDLELVVDGAEVKLDPRLTEPVFNALPHLVNNALHHGIEMPWERGNKPTRATLRVCFAELEGAWRIDVSDDGRGFPLERLRAKAVERGLISADQALDDQQAAALAFADGVSTADSVTDVAGRGVGMSAVLGAVRAAGGRVDLQTAPGRGSTIRMEVPKPR